MSFARVFFISVIYFHFVCFADFIIYIQVYKYTHMRRTPMKKVYNRAHIIAGRQKKSHRDNGKSCQHW